MIRIRMITVILSRMITVIIISMIMIIICISSGFGDKSFGRQKTKDRWGRLPSTPPPLVLYFYHLLLLGVSVHVC